ncbi:hypothetical protein BBF96_07915 [Anoxybacter fermentans]|uniref:HPt domain-containing protein n=1 Tax=Anoxybacter fermentans TaxID=1323375 RepID=A0A3S9SYF5_9FIRM|nr:Hpt domain-containing protein [Anoxybacter fermentans]AZR73315.1 hypothetical protein BBF96_07915 [Anoxybacter fermentans]
MFNEESLPYIEVFLEETTEQLQELEGKLVFLEKDPSNRTCLDDIFRIAHNLKGNAATVGFQEMTTLAHHMEDLLDSMRKSRVYPSGEIIDTLLDALDALKGLTDKACGKGEGIFELGNLINRLEYLTYGGHDTNALIDSKENELLIKLEDSCCMKAARAFVVLKSLEELVRIIDVQPSFDEIKEYGFEGTEIKVRFFTRESLDIVKEAVQAIPEVKEVELFCGEIKKEKEMALSIEVGARLDPQALEERLRERYTSRVVIDLTDLCELSPAGLSRLLWARNLTGVEFILPRHPFRKKFLELLGFGENIGCGGVEPELVMKKKYDRVY